MVATRTINAVIVSSLEKVDARLTMPQLRVMVILTRLDSASLTEVAEDLGVNQSNASRTCDQLARRGLVERHEDSSDRRRLSLRLSPSGRRLVREVMGSRRQLLEAIVAALPLERQRVLMTALESFNQAAKQTGAPDGSEARSLRRVDRWLG